MTHAGSYWVVIPAAGSGKRFKSSNPKQFLELQGKTVLQHSLDLFLADPLNLGVIVALDKNNLDFPLVKHNKLSVVEGGQERCHSVYNALAFLQANNVDSTCRVLVHDAARPCLSSTDLTRLLMFDLEKDLGAILAAKVTDTLKYEAENQWVEETVNREHFWQAQTPQMAQLQTLKNAIEKMLADGFLPTDESAALEHSGFAVKLIEAQDNNMKITRPGDLELASFVLQNRKEQPHS